MNILIDTNVVIPLEPTCPEHVEAKTALAADFVRAASSGGHRLLLHPESLRELAGDRDATRRATRSVLIRKYQQLDPPPPLGDDVVSTLGRVDTSSHDYVDHLMLAAVHADAVDFLVTDDGAIRSKASRLGLGDRVMTVEDVLAFLTSLEGRTPPPPPFVEAVKAYELDERDPIFESFRAEYDDFDRWLVRCKREQRPAWVVRDDGRLAAVCIVKERDDELSLGGHTLKICSLKVAEERPGRRYGELLLKTLFHYLWENRYDFAFVTVFPQHGGLIALLEDFGFGRRLPDTGRGEFVYVKALRPSPEDRGSMQPLEFHVRFGPPAVKLVPGGVYLVPIRPRYHRLLFPDAEPQPEERDQLELPLGLPPAEPPGPFGNALRKAYLSKSSIRQLGSGAALLFYRSWDIQAVTSIGVVEDTMRSRDAQQVAAFVGQRTVYTLDEISSMCAEREVIAIRFRQDRLLPTPIPETELVSKGVARRAPQSIASVPPEVIPWLVRRIGG